MSAGLSSNIATSHHARASWKAVSVMADHHVRVLALSFIESVRKDCSRRALGRDVGP